MSILLFFSLLYNPHQLNPDNFLSLVIIQLPNYVNNLNFDMSLITLLIHGNRQSFINILAS